MMMMIFFFFFFFLQPGDPDYKKFMGHDKLAKKRRKNLKLFEDKKPGDVSLDAVNKKRIEIMSNQNLSERESSMCEVSKKKIGQEMSVAKINKRKNGVMSTERTQQEIL